jgi:hypothetical protein
MTAIWVAAVPSEFRRRIDSSSGEIYNRGNGTVYASSCNVNYSTAAGVDSTGFAREHFPVLNVPHSSVLPSFLPASTEMRRLKHFTVSEAFHCSLGFLFVFFNFSLLLENFHCLH